MSFFCNCIIVLACFYSILTCKPFSVTLIRHCFPGIFSKLWYFAYIFTEFSLIAYQCMKIIYLLILFSKMHDFSHLHSARIFYELQYALFLRLSVTMWFRTKPEQLYLMYIFISYFSSYYYHYVLKLLKDMNSETYLVPGLTLVVTLLLLLHSLQGWKWVQHFPCVIHDHHLQWM